MWIVRVAERELWVNRFFTNRIFKKSRKTLVIIGKKVEFQEEV